MVRKYVLVIWEDDVKMNKKTFWSVIQSTLLRPGAEDVEQLHDYSEEEMKAKCQMAVWGKKKLKCCIDRFDDDEKTLKYAGSKLNLNFWRQRFDCGGCGSQTPDGPAEKKQKKAPSFTASRASYDISSSDEENPKDADFRPNSELLKENSKLRQQNKMLTNENSRLLKNIKALEASDELLDTMKCLQQSLSKSVVPHTATAPQSQSLPRSPQLSRSPTPVQYSPQPVPCSSQSDEDSGPLAGSQYSEKWANAARQVQSSSSTFSSFIIGMFKVVYAGPEGREYMATHSLTGRRGLTKSDTESDNGKDALPASDVYSAIYETQKRFPSVSKRDIRATITRLLNNEAKAYKTFN